MASFFLTHGGGALAFKEDTAPVPGTPSSYSDLVKEIREYAKSLEVKNRLTALGAALKHYEGQQSKDNHFYLLEVDYNQQIVNVTGFKQSESEKANAKYLEVEKKIKTSPNLDAVLVSVDSMNSLRQAYPNYFLDTGVFLGVMNDILSSRPRLIAKRQIKRIVDQGSLF